MRSLRLNTFWIVCASLMMGAFNNCSEIQTAQGAGSTASENKNAGTSGGLNYNGSGYSGKVVFAHYGATPVCQTASSADSEIRLGDGQIELYTNTCSSTSVQVLREDQIFSNPYDPFYLVHNEQVYVNESITAGAGPGVRKIVHAFCYNAEAEVDFAIRMESRFNNGWKVRTFGHAIFGRGKDAPEVREIPGVLRETSDPDNQPFVAHSGSVRLDFMTKISPSRGPAVLTLDNGGTLPMDCFYLRLPGPPDANTSTNGN